MYSGGLMTFGEIELLRTNQPDDFIIYPEIRARRYHSRIMFEFEWSPDFNSIEVHCRRGKETTFTLLKETSYRCYSDIRPDLINYTEIRHYKFYYLKDGVRSPEAVEMRIRTKGKFIFF